MSNPVAVSQDGITVWANTYNEANDDWWTIKELEDQIVAMRRLGYNNLTDYYKHVGII